MRKDKTMAQRIVERVALVVQGNLVVTDCSRCGLAFALPQEFINRRREDREPFYCPNGHALSYGKTANEKKIESLERNLEWARNSAMGHERRADAAERSLRATKGVVTKMKKRAAAGVCPCCSRTFQNLARHMAGQHPEYGGSND